MSRYVVIILIFFGGISLFSCDDSALYDHNNKLDGSWKSKQKLKYSFEVTDSLQAYDFYINIRNSTDYRFSNIYFFMTTHFPNNQLAIDTIECFVSNSKGEWLGEGLGKFRDLQLQLKRNGRFPYCGKYTIEMEQATREPALEGIEAVGIRIEKTKKR